MPHPIRTASANSSDGVKDTSVKTKDLTAKAKDLTAKAKDLTTKVKDLTVKAKDLTAKAKSKDLPLNAKPVVRAKDIVNIVKPKRLCMQTFAKLRNLQRRICPVDS